MLVNSVTSLLNALYPAGRGVPMSGDGGSPDRLGVFGDDLEGLAGKTVMDFGCGAGAATVELARRGAVRVVGLDIRENVLSVARQRARSAGVERQCEFVTTFHEPVDVILTIDAFEHFADPAGVLLEMHRLLRSDGYVLAAWGYPWLHPYGGHLFSVFPWAHLLLPERSLVGWRATFKDDGATRFEEAEGGLNRMTISRWEQLVEDSPFRFASYELVPIRRLRRLHNWMTRELLTSVVRARLVPK